jgi:hypothetical protein
VWFRTRFVSVDGETVESSNGAVPMLQRMPILVLVAIVASLIVPTAASAAPPVNDAFASPTTLTGTPAKAIGTNVDATKETSETGGRGGRTVWFAWTATFTGPATVSTCASGFDTILTTFTGSSLATLSNLGSNDDDCGERSLRSSVTFTAQVGTLYRFQVDGYSSSNTGPIAISVVAGGEPPADYDGDGIGDALDCAGTDANRPFQGGDDLDCDGIEDASVEPENDDFASSLQLDGYPESRVGTIQFASVEPGEPNHGPGFDASVWWSWIAPVSGTVIVEACEADFRTGIEIYTGPSVTELEQVPSTDYGSLVCSFHVGHPAVPRRCRR